jgi:hypothetical protein
MKRNLSQRRRKFRIMGRVEYPVENITQYLLVIG